MNKIHVNVSKIKPKFPFHHNIPCLFQVVTTKWFILWYQLCFIKVDLWIVVTTTVIFWIKTQDHGGDVMITPFRISEGILIVSMMNYQMKMYTISDF